jgi:nucleoside-diphosphate-sugar epimerase
MIFALNFFESIYLYCDQNVHSVDVSRLEKELGYCQTVSVQEGVSHFVKWYREFYQV